jgi:hypothetical protein
MMKDCSRRGNEADVTYIDTVPKDTQNEILVATFVETFVGLGFFDKDCDEGCDQGSDANCATLLMSLRFMMESVWSAVASANPEFVIASPTGIRASCDVWFRAHTKSVAADTSSAAVRGNSAEEEATRRS